VSFFASSASLRSSGDKSGGFGSWDSDPAVRKPKAMRMIAPLFDCVIRLSSMGDKP